MKEEVKGDAELAAAFAAETAADVMGALEGSRARPALRRGARRSRTAASSGARRSGRTSSSTRPGSRARRRSSRPCAATSRPTTTTRPSSTRVKRRPRRRPCAELMDGVPPGEARATGCRPRSTLSLGLNPLTPDHHFFIDQGTERAAAPGARRDRPQAGRAGRARRPRGRDVPPLQRAARLLIGGGRARRARPRLASAATTARTPSSCARPTWIGTATEDALGVPVPRRCGASRRSSTAGAALAPARSSGLAALARRGRGARRASSRRSRSSTRCRTATSWSAG